MEKDFKEKLIGIGFSEISIIEKIDSLFLLYNKYETQTILDLATFCKKHTLEDDIKIVIDAFEFNDRMCFEIYKSIKQIEDQYAQMFGDYFCKNPEKLLDSRNFSNHQYHKVLISKLRKIDEEISDAAILLLFNNSNNYGELKNLFLQFDDKIITDILKNNNLFFSEFLVENLVVIENIKNYIVNHDLIINNDNLIFSERIFEYLESKIIDVPKNSLETIFYTLYVCNPQKEIFSKLTQNVMFYLKEKRLGFLFDDLNCFSNCLLIKNIVTNQYDFSLIKTKYFTKQPTFMISKINDDQVVLLTKEKLNNKNYRKRIYLDNLILELFKINQWCIMSDVVPIFVIYDSEDKTEKIFLESGAQKVLEYFSK